MKKLPLLIVGPFVAVLLNVSGVSAEQVMDAVGLHEVSNAITIAKNGFEQAAAALGKIN